MSKISDLSPSDVFFQVINAPKPVYGRGSPRTAGRAYELRLTSRLGRGTPKNVMLSPVDAFGLSISAPRLLCAPLQENFLATPTDLAQ